MDPLQRIGRQLLEHLTPLPGLPGSDDQVSREEMLERQADKFVRPMPVDRLAMHRGRNLTPEERAELQGPGLQNVWQSPES